MNFPVWPGRSARARTRCAAANVAAKETPAWPHEANTCRGLASPTTSPPSVTSREPGPDDWAWLISQPDRVEPVTDGHTPLSRWLDAVAAQYQSSGTAWSVFLADRLAEIGATCRYLHASTPAEYVDRLECLSIARDGGPR